MSVEEKVIEIVSQSSVVSKEEITVDDELINLGIDSVSIVNMILALETKFNVEFDNSKLDPVQLKTVKSVINLVKEHI